MTWLTRRTLYYGLLAAGIGLWLAASPAQAQYSSTITSTGLSSSSSGGGGSFGGGSSSGGGGSFGGGSSSGGIGGGGSSSGGIGGGARTGMGGTGGTGGSGISGSASGSGVDATNFLKSSYSNPTYMGRPNQTTTTNSTGSTLGAAVQSSQSGGFGQPSFGATSGGTSRTGGLGGVASTSTGLGRTGGLGGGGLNSNSNSNQSQNTASRIVYSATLRFQPKPIAVAQMHSDLNGLVARSTNLSNPAGVRVSVENDAVILRGKVANADEARLVENMIRLSPGVRNVKNELEMQE